MSRIKRCVAARSVQIRWPDWHVSENYTARFCQWSLLFCYHVIYIWPVSLAKSDGPLALWLLQKAPTLVVDNCDDANDSRAVCQPRTMVLIMQMPLIRYRFSRNLFLTSWMGTVVMATTSGHRPLWWYAVMFKGVHKKGNSAEDNKRDVRWLLFFKLS